MVEVFVNVKIDMVYNALPDLAHYGLKMLLILLHSKPIFFGVCHSLKCIQIAITKSALQM